MQTNIDLQLAFGMGSVNGKQKLTPFWLFSQAMKWNYEDRGVEFTGGMQQVMLFTRGQWEVCFSMHPPETMIVVSTSVADNDEEREEFVEARPQSLQGLLEL